MNRCMGKELSIKILSPSFDLISKDLKSAIFNLNQSNIPALGSVNNLEHVQQLYDFSAYCYVLFKKNQLIAFVLVMDENSLYQSPNYAFFVYPQNGVIKKINLIIDYPFNYNY